MNEKMNSARPEKKSETIEVRVSYSEKLAFMEACKQAGTTASHAIRGYIGDFLGPERAMQKRSQILIAMALLVLSVVAAAAFVWTNSGPQAATTGTRVVQYFDKDGDGVITLADSAGNNATTEDTIRWLMATVDTNADSRITPKEISHLANITFELRGNPSAENRAGIEKLLVVPPGMNEAERAAFLEQSGIEQHINPEDMTRLTRLIDALHAEGTKNSNLNN